jgi:hypothetical protein
MMNCNQVQTQLDEYLDRNLSAIQQNALQQHLERCSHCRRKFDHARNLQLVLLDLPVPKPTPGFSSRAFRFLHPRGSRNSHWIAAAGGALAATLALWLVFATGVYQPSPSIEVVQLRVEPNQVQTVNLVFQSTTDIDQATLRIELPGNLQLAGAPQRRVIEWKTPLKKGSNRLALPVIATDTRTARLTTRISHNNRDRIFYVDVTPRIPKSSQHTPAHKITI